MKKKKNKGQKAAKKTIVPKGKRVLKKKHEKVVGFVKKKENTRPKKTIVSKGKKVLKKRSEKVEKQLKKQPAKETKKIFPSDTWRKKIEKGTKKVSEKTETLLTLQTKLIEEEEKRIQRKKNKKQIQKDNEKLRSLYGELGYHEKENNKTKEKLSELKKQIKNKKISKKTLKEKLISISKLENMLKDDKTFRSEMIEGKTFFKFSTHLDRDEISRVKGNSFNYYINDIFLNPLVITNKEIKGEGFEKKILNFLEKGIRNGMKDLQYKIKNGLNLKGEPTDQRGIEGVKGSLLGLKKQLTKILENKKSLKFKTKEEREEYLDKADEEAKTKTDGTPTPIMISRFNNTIKILG